MECTKCGNNLFLIQEILCCDDCDQNPAWTDDGYTYDLKEIDEKELERVGVSENGECKLGSAYGAGCHLYICSKCREENHWPAVEGC